MVFFVISWDVNGFLCYCTTFHLWRRQADIWAPAASIDAKSWINREIYLHFCYRCINIKKTKIQKNTFVVFLYQNHEITKETVYILVSFVSQAWNNQDTRLHSCYLLSESWHNQENNLHSLYLLYQNHEIIKKTIYILVTFVSES